MIHPERIAHVVLKVRNVEQSRKFYTETLGMHVMKHVPEIKAVFLSFNGRDHHEIAPPKHPQAWQSHSTIARQAACLQPAIR